MNLQIYNKVQTYLRLNNIEIAAKKRKEKLEAITKGLVVGKTPKETIRDLNELIAMVNVKLDASLKQSVENIEEISKFKCIENE